MLQLRIKEICKEQGITLNTLAERIGVSQPSISGLATGKQKPSLDTLEKLCQALNVEIGELFTRKESDTMICPKCGSKFKMINE